MRLDKKRFGVYNQKGEMVLELLVDKNGKVLRITVKSNDTKNSQLEKCITAEINSWKFVSLKDAETITITCPFIYKVSN